MYYFRPLVEVAFTVSFIKQVVCIFIINLNKWNLKFIGIVHSPFKLLKDIAEHSGNNSSLFPLVTPIHSECFSTACLTICKYRAIVAFQAIVDDWLGKRVKYLLLRCIFRKDLIEHKLILVFSIGQFVPGDL